MQRITRFPQLLLVLSIVLLVLATGCATQEERAAVLEATPAPAATAAPSATPAPPTPTPTAAPPPVYVALGASDAVGVGADNPAAEAWPAVVHAGLPQGTQFINLGISGATLGDVVRDELPPALDARPGIVSIWPGVNDLRARVPLATFTSQLDQILGRFSQPQGDSPTLVVLNIPDLRRLPVFAVVDPALLDATVREWNVAIAEVAQRHGAIQIDLYGQAPELVEHDEYISADGFHPSSAGYRRIAELVLTALDEHVSSSAR